MVTIPSFSSVPGAAIPGTIRPGLVQHATAATSYPFYGHVKLWYWDYVDISTQEKAQQGRLPCARRPREELERARSDAEADVGQDLRPEAVAHADVLELHHRPLSAGQQALHVRLEVQGRAVSRLSVDRESPDGRVETAFTGKG